MPVWLRKFTFNLIREFNEQSNPAPQTLDEQAKLIKEGKIELPSQPLANPTATRPKPKINY
jgi:hypothetical protein